MDDHRENPPAWSIRSWKSPNLRPPNNPAEVKDKTVVGANNKILTYGVGRGIKRVYYRIRRVFC
jgi:hypothetical protein